MSEVTVVDTLQGGTEWLKMFAADLQKTAAAASAAAVGVTEPFQTAYGKPGESRADALDRALGIGHPKPRRKCKAASVFLRLLDTVSRGLDATIFNIKGATDEDRTKGYYVTTTLLSTGVGLGCVIGYLLGL